MPNNGHVSVKMGWWNKKDESPERPKKTNRLARTIIHCNSVAVFTLLSERTKTDRMHIRICATDVFRRRLQCTVINLSFLGACQVHDQLMMGSACGIGSMPPCQPVVCGCVLQAAFNPAASIPVAFQCRSSTMRFHPGMSKISESKKSTDTAWV